MVITDSIRDHLRKALSEIVSAEKTRLHQYYDKNDEEHAQRVEKLRPVLDALRVLSREIGIVEGVDISVSEHGHMATVYLRSAASTHSFSLSTSLRNRCFTVEQRDSYSFSGESFEKTHELDESDAALAIVVEAIGKHIAQLEVLKERRK